MKPALTEAATRHRVYKCPDCKTTMKEQKGKPLECECKPSYGWSITENNEQLEGAIECLAIALEKLDKNPHWIDFAHYCIKSNVLA
jgi:hypothetical protein